MVKRDNAATILEIDSNYAIADTLIVDKKSSQVYILLLQFSALDPKATNQVPAITSESITSVTKMEIMRN